MLQNVSVTYHDKAEICALRVNFKKRAMGFKELNCANACMLQKNNICPKLRSTCLPGC